MPAIPLSENPSLEQLKKQARDLQRLARAGDHGAIALLTEHHPRAAQLDLSSFKRTDAQLVVARIYGFPSWAQLADQVAVRRRLGRPDTADVRPNNAADEFAALAAVAYNGDDPRPRVERAAAMLAENQSVATETIAAMAAAGLHQPLLDLVVGAPDIVNVSTGPNDWPPLLYAAYSRLEPRNPEYSTLETARVLLDHGADPNAGFLWRGLVPPFTALTGAFGGGERDQPPHPAADALARLLLEHGADPNDGQALYNNGLAGSPRDDTAHLELLLEFGLGTDRGGPWYEHLGTQLTPPQELLYDELEVAAHRGLVRRMEFLTGLGLDLTRPVGRSQLPPATIAAQRGHDGVLAVLAEVGISPD